MEKHYTNQVFRIFVVIMLQAMLLIFLPAWAAKPVTENYQLAPRYYKVTLVQTELTGAVDEEIFLSFTLDPPELVQGLFMSVNLKVIEEPKLEKPNKPRILTGFPETSAMFRTPGIYRYLIMVSLLAKNSCGGLEVDIIFSQEVHIEIHP